MSFLRFFVQPRMLRCLAVAKLLRVPVRFDSAEVNRGRWRRTWSLKGQSGEILLGPDADALTLLHEIGHHFCGLDCCREHCEFEAHGVMVFLARILRVPLKDAELMDAYAGYSTLHPDACARMARNLKGGSQ